jgi:hypothetical protein
MRKAAVNLGVKTFPTPLIGPRGKLFRRTIALRVATPV